MSGFRIRKLADTTKAIDFKDDEVKAICVADWANITLGTDWKRDSAITTIHCTDGNITL